MRRLIALAVGAWRPRPRSRGSLRTLSGLVPLVVLVLMTACGTPSMGGDGGPVVVLPDGGVAPVQSSPPVVTKAELHASGRFGTDLQLSISGTDVNSDAQGVRITFQNAAGTGVPAFDLDGDGTAESAEGPAELSNAVAGKPSFAATARFPDLFKAHPQIAKAVVVVSDAAGLSSAPSTAAVIAQVVRAHGDGCDPTYVLDRCPADQGCKGTPATCADGEAPKVEQAGYFRDPKGPHTLARLSDKDGDADHVRADFFDATGNPVSIDTNNDGSPDATGFDFGGMALLGPQTFLLVSQSGQGFDDQVKRLVLTPVDAEGHRGTPTTVNLSDPPLRSLGQTCSPFGLDKCAGGAVCSEGAPGTFSCVALQSSRTKACGAAPVLGPSTGVFVVAGVTRATSLWDPPAGCSPQDPAGRPEGVAILKLTARAESVTLTTARPGTTFDTVLSVFASCSAPTALACNDDGPTGSASTLTLTNVAAGEYVVVVDSWNAAGGTWELAVTVH